MSQILVRQPTVRDQPAIAEVNALAIADLRKVYRPNQKALDNRRSILSTLACLVATIDGSVVGTVQYRIEDTRLFLTALSVHPTQRRRGVARALLTAAAGIAEEGGATCLALHTVKETGNVTIFEHMGFRTIEESDEDCFDSDVFDVLTNVYMERMVGNEG